MTIPVRHLPWIGGAASAAPSAQFSPLVSPIDESVESHFIELDAGVVDAAVKHAHAAFVAHQDAPMAKRIEWLTAAADAIDKIEAELVRSLIRVIGKPKRASTSRRKRAGAFIRACAAQLPHINGEVLPLDATPTGAGRFGFTVRVPYGVVAAVTPFNGPVNLLVQKVAPALAVGNAVVVKPSPPGTEVALLIAEAMQKANVPDGLFNVVPGGRQTAHLLAAHPLVAALTVTEAPRPAMNWRAPPAPRNSSVSLGPTPRTSSAPTPTSPTPRRASLAPASKRAGSSASPPSG